MYAGSQYIGAGGQVPSIVDASVEMAEGTLGEIGSLVGFVLEWCQQGNKFCIIYICISQHTGNEEH